MAADRVAGLTTLLAETEAAHGAYETTELNGAYDEDWPRWYAAYAVDHGIGALVGRPVSAEDLERLLADSWRAFQRTEPQPADGWAVHAARRIAAELELPGDVSRTARSIEGSEAPEA